ncbi:hypothetical protein YC2023_035216 [Brassica napus]
MGIDVKETGATIWKVFRFSMNTSIKFMRNHPVSSGVSMFLLALYVIFPSLFFFLIYSSPVLACGVVYAREKMGLSFPSSGSKSCGGEKDGVRCHLRQQRSVRRNARMQVEEWDSQTSEEEKDKVILTSLYNDLLGRKPHFEESPKAIETEVVEDNEKSVGEEDSQMSYVNVEEPMVCNKIKEEKERMREEMSNSNEHGVSEIDRDRRLESLVARRRTKRLFKLALHQHNKLQAEETASPTHNNNLRINIPGKNNNNNPFEKHLENEYEQNTIEDDNKCVESGKLEVNNETDSNNEDDDDDSSCSEESESEHNRFNKAELREAISHTMDNYPSFLVNQARNNIPSPLPRGLAPPKIDDKNMFYARRREHSHSRTFSMASDMQVEVSEIGSPPTMVDWLDEWSNDGESYIYDTDIDREVIRGEESCKSVSSQCESKEDNSWLETKPVAEHLRMTDDMYTRSQAEENFDQKFSSLSDVSKLTRGLLFHTSVSLSSITEEPETIFDSVDGETSENMNILTTNLADQISPDSSRKKFLDEEVIDVQPLENNDLCGSPKIVASNIIDHQQKDQILNSIQGEYDTNQIHMKNENTKPKEYEATQSLLDASLDIPYIESFEREINEKEEEDEPELDNFTKVVTIQTEDKALQDDLKSSPSHVLTKLLESEATVENGLELALDESTEHPLSNEVESSRLSKDLCGESAQEFNNITNVEEESTVSEGTHNSQGSQPWTQQVLPTFLIIFENKLSFTIHGTDSSEGISARTLEITQQPEHSDAIYSNTVSQDTTDEDIFAKDSTATEKNDEEKLKPDEQVIEQAVEKEIELDLQSMHHNTGLVSKEDDEESKKVNRAVHKAETTTAKTETET